MTNLNMKNGQYTDLQPKCIVLGTPKKPEKGQKLGKIKTELGKINWFK